MTYQVSKSYFEIISDHGFIFISSYFFKIYYLFNQMRCTSTLKDPIKGRFLKY